MTTLTYNIQLAIAILEDAKELAKATTRDHKALEAKLLELTKAESQIWIEYDRSRHA
jgi:hypothetical protein